MQPRLAAAERFVPQNLRQLSISAVSACYRRSLATLAQGQAVSIEVSATDRPGHNTSKTQARNKGDGANGAGAGDAPAFPVRSLSYS